MHCRKSDIQAHSKIAMTLIAFTKTCVCVQLEVTEKQDHNASKCLCSTGGLVDRDWEGTHAPCLPHGPSASNFHTGSIS